MFRGVFLAALAGVCLCAQGQAPKLFRTRNHRPVSLVFLRVPTLGPSLAAGRQEWQLDWHIANDFRGAGPIDEDSETLRLAATYRRGFRGFEGFVEVPVLLRGGGILDPIMDGWHKSVLGWKNQLRDATAFGRSVVTGPGYRFGSEGGLGDITVGGSKDLPSVGTLRLALKVPTGAPAKLLGSGGVDVGLSLERVWALARGFFLGGQVGLVLQGGASRLSGGRKWIDQEVFGIVWQKNSRDTWIVQLNSERAPATLGSGETDSTHRIVSFVFRRKIAKNEYWELYFSEDRDLLNGEVPALANVGPDFTAGMRWTIATP